MDPKRWSQVEQLFHTALRREPGQRTVFLAKACGDDDDLRREVESLLAQRGSTEGLIDHSAWAAETGLAETATILTTGARLGPYKILGPLGAGGMGQVYRAVDTRLDRPVAIKTSALRFSGRFEREARAISALNHAHICTLYDVGPNYLVMELVEGETLGARLAKGPLPPDLVLQYGAQIADALAAAHSFNIIHRDLKPGNIMLTRAGIKVLDFGLAKFTDTADATPKHAETLTEERAIVGTPAYMAPEQLSGEEVDARTDLFCFGAVLYEMATGQRAFRHLDRTPPPSAKTSPGLQRIIKKLLETDRGLRYQSASGVLSDLERLRQAPSGRPRWIVALAAAAVGGALLTVPIWWRKHSQPAARSEWIQITKFPDSVTQPAFSPDGRMLTFLRGPNTFIGQSEVYVKLLPDGDPAQLTRDGMPKMSPAFSPDGSRIAYTALGPASAWDTWTVPVLRGAPQLWLPNTAAVTWLDKQRVLYSEIKTGFHMAVATSLESRAEHRDVYVPAHENGMAHKSYLSPDGKSVLIVEMDEKGAWQPCRLVPFDGLSIGRLVGPPGAPCTAGAWSPDGNWMYLNLSAGGDFHLWRQHVPNGKPEQLTSGPAGEEGIALASDGRSLITAVGVRQRPVWFHDRVAEQQVSIEGYEESPQLYSEARKVAYLRLDRFQNGPTPAEIWAADLDSGRNEPLLPGIRVTQFSISSEGRLVACALDAAGNTRLWLAELDRRSPPRQIGSVEPKQAYFGPKGVIYFLATEGTGQYVYEIAENGTGLRKLQTESIEEIHSVSPDGRWVSGYGAVPGQKGLDLELAFPTAGGEPVSICSPPCSARWARGGEYLYVSWAGGYQSHAAVGHTYVLPTRPGTMFPNLPPGGFRSEGELAAVPGVRVIAAADVGSGPSPDVYVFSRENVQRNLYRIPLP